MLGELVETDDLTTWEREIARPVPPGAERSWAASRPAGWAGLLRRGARKGRRPPRVAVVRCPACWWSDPAPLTTASRRATAAQDPAEEEALTVRVVCTSAGAGCSLPWRARRRRRARSMVSRMAKPRAVDRRVGANQSVGGRCSLCRSRVGGRRPWRRTPGPACHLALCTSLGGGAASSAPTCPARGRRPGRPAARRRPRPGRRRPGPGRLAFSAHRGDSRRHPGPLAWAVVTSCWSVSSRLKQSDHLPPRRCLVARRAAPCGRAAGGGWRALHAGASSRTRACSGKLCHGTSSRPSARRRTVHGNRSLTLVSLGARPEPAPGRGRRLPAERERSGPRETC